MQNNRVKAILCIVFVIVIICIVIYINKYGSKFKQSPESNNGEITNRTGLLPPQIVSADYDGKDIIVKWSDVDDSSNSIASSSILSTRTEPDYYIIYRYEDDPLKGARYIQEVNSLYKKHGLIDGIDNDEGNKNIVRTSHSITFKELTNPINYFRVRAILISKSKDTVIVKSEFSKIAICKMDCVLNITKSKLNPDFVTTTRRLSWNRIKNAREYGITIKCRGCIYQYLLEDVINIKSDKSNLNSINRMSISISHVKHIQSIFMLCVNECGQSNIILCYNADTSWI